MGDAERTRTRTLRAYPFLKRWETNESFLVLAAMILDGADEGYVDLIKNLANLGAETADVEAVLELIESVRSLQEVLGPIVEAQGGWKEVPRK